MTTLAPDQTPDGWNRAATAYDRSIDRITSMYAREAVRMLGVEKGHRLLDVAAGPGAAAFAAAEQGAQVLATDYSAEMIERLRARAAAAGAVGMETAVMDGQELELPDGSFDLATCVFGLMFFPDQDKGCRELYRVLRPGGRAAVATWAVPERNPWMPIWRQAAAAALPELPSPAAPPASLSDPKLLEGKLSAAGFREVRVTPVVREWRFDSPQSFWDELHDASPVFLALASSFGDRVELVRGTLLSMLRESYGDGPVVFDGEALVGLGVKS